MEHQHVIQNRTALQSHKLPRRLNNEQRPRSRNRSRGRTRSSAATMGESARVGRSRREHGQPAAQGDEYVVACSVTEAPAKHRHLIQRRATVQSHGLSFRARSRSNGSRAARANDASPNPPPLKPRKNLNTRKTDIRRKENPNLKRNGPNRNISLCSDETLEVTAAALASSPGDLSVASGETMQHAGKIDINGRCIRHPSIELCRKGATNNSNCWKVLLQDCPLCSFGKIDDQEFSTNFNPEITDTGRKMGEGVSNIVPFNHFAKTDPKHEVTKERYFHSKPVSNIAGNKKEIDSTNTLTTSPSSSSSESTARSWTMSDVSSSEEEDNSNTSKLSLKPPAPPPKSSHCDGLAPPPVIAPNQPPSGISSPAPSPRNHHEADSAENHVHSIPNSDITENRNLSIGKRQERKSSLQSVRSLKELGRKLITETGNFSADSSSLGTKSSTPRCNQTHGDQPTNYVLPIGESKRSTHEDGNRRERDQRDVASREHRRRNRSGSVGNSSLNSEIINRKSLGRGTNPATSCLPQRTDESTENILGAAAEIRSRAKRSVSRSRERLKQAAIFCGEKNSEESKYDYGDDLTATNAEAGNHPGDNQAGQPSFGRKKTSSNAITLAQGEAATMTERKRSILNPHGLHKELDTPTTERRIMQLKPHELQQSKIKPPLRHMSMSLSSQGISRHLNEEMIDPCPQLAQSNVPRAKARSSTPSRERINRSNPNSRNRFEVEKQNNKELRSRQNWQNRRCLINPSSNFTEGAPPMAVERIDVAPENEYTSHLAQTSTIDSKKHGYEDENQGNSVAENFQSSAEALIHRRREMRQKISERLHSKKDDCSINDNSLDEQSYFLGPEDNLDLRKEVLRQWPRISSDDDAVTSKPTQQKGQRRGRSRSVVRHTISKIRSSSKRSLRTKQASISKTDEDYCSIDSGKRSNSSLRQRMMKVTNIRRSRSRSLCLDSSEVSDDRSDIKSETYNQNGRMWETSSRGSSSTLKRESSRSRDSSRIRRFFSRSGADRADRDYRVKDASENENHTRGRRRRSFSLRRSFSSKRRDSSLSLSNH